MSNVKDKKLKIKEDYVFAYCVLAYLLPNMHSFLLHIFLSLLVMFSNTKKNLVSWDFSAKLS